MFSDAKDAFLKLGRYCWFRVFKKDCNKMMHYFCYILWSFLFWTEETKNDFFDRTSVILYNFRGSIANWFLIFNLFYMNNVGMFSFSLDIFTLILLPNFLQNFYFSIFYFSLIQMLKVIGWWVGRLMLSLNKVSQI